MQRGDGGIFISYRRKDTAWPARQLYEHLVSRFGTEAVFTDVDDIEPGEDFVTRITTAVAACDVLLALIGQQWLTVTNEQGVRRLDDPDDFVRLEIVAALAREVRVIPVLIDGARMPRADELPAELVPLTRRHAVEITPAGFDTARLVTWLATLLEAPAGPTHVGSAREPRSDGAASRGTSFEPRPPQPDIFRTEHAVATTPVVAAAGFRTSPPKRGTSLRTPLLFGSLLSVLVVLVGLAAWRFWPVTTTTGGPSESPTTTSTTSPADRLQEPVSARAGALTLKILSVQVDRSSTRLRLTATNRASFPVSIPLFGNCQLIQPQREPLKPLLGLGKTGSLEVPGESVPVTSILEFGGVPTAGATTMTLACQTLFWQGPGQPSSLQVKNIRLR